jgi:hypothetical protein
MGARIVRSFLILAMLFGVVGTPLSAAIFPEASRAITHLADVECQSDETTDNNSQAPADLSGAHHHHCTHAVPVVFPALLNSDYALVAERHSLTVSALSSLGRAPPTQPPSA